MTYTHRASDKIIYHTATITNSTRIVEYVRAIVRPVYMVELINSILIFRRVTRSSRSYSIHTLRFPIVFYHYNIIITVTTERLTTSEQRFSVAYLEGGPPRSPATPIPHKSYL